MCIDMLTVYLTGAYQISCTTAFVCIIYVSKGTDGRYGKIIMKIVTEAMQAMKIMRLTGRRSARLLQRRERRRVIRRRSWQTDFLCRTRR